MSITSVELNYLIWRYLQESGHELAAFALDKHTKCSSYEHDKNQSILSHIEPGCLVKLVQRGILFTIAKEETENLDGEESKLSLLSALAKEDASMRDGVNNSENSGASNGSSGIQQERDRNAAKDATNSEMDIDMKGAGSIGDNDRKTNRIIKRVYSTVDLPESFTAQWHPSTDVFAYGTDNSKAVINAIKGGKIAETVTLNHPNIIDYNNELSNERANEITTVSWSPKGNVLVTAGVDGQLRAWSPDGKLKNVSSTAGDIESELPTANITSKNRTLIGKLIWSLNGNYILSVDTNNQVVLLDGNHLKPLKVVRASTTSVEDITLFDACWLDDHKFALSTSKKGVNIYSIVELDSDDVYQKDVYPHTHDNIEVNLIGSLPGHNNEVSCLCFNNSLKLLASCSDSDYSIRIWRSNSSNFLELDATRELKRAYNHLSPIICLTWLSQNEKFLLSVSMEGIINIWDGSDGKAVKSVNLTLCLEQSTLEGSDVSLASWKDMLIYTAAVSPDGKWIALGDGSGRISIWDITVGDETKENANFLKCVGLYERPPSESNNEKPDEKAVICEVSWDQSSKKVAASYRGSSSVIFDWDERE
ncbi:Piso0_002329 [Millerozyma farinosa CBS 7064]|uniref:Piso0_002329 protein n=1 Tax=Pichia sorbitophila (strain ATCC MYA-4447 / BCRC 22081 / CBS 7064 / NBRC 10061 / NRRL Y-12695) TaxID=559304 RepID=G8YCB6_PICSO|nr:Piso0_002329 [Millerozyma farinosa CBS 7064]